MVHRDLNGIQPIMFKWTLFEIHVINARVVVLADTPHSHKGHCVLIGLVRVDIVQGGGTPWVPVTACEVDTDSEVDLTAAHDVLQERVHPGRLWICKKWVTNNKLIICDRLQEKDAFRAKLTFVQDTL